MLRWPLLVLHFNNFNISFDFESTLLLHLKFKLLWFAHSSGPESISHKIIRMQIQKLNKLPSSCWEFQKDDKSLKVYREMMEKTKDQGRMHYWERKNEKEELFKCIINKKSVKQDCIDDKGNIVLKHCQKKVINSFTHYS